MSGPHLHLEPQWIERALSALALYGSSLTVKLFKKGRLAKRLDGVELKLDDVVQSTAGFARGVYRRLGRVESQLNVTPSPIDPNAPLGPEEVTKKPGGKP